MSFCVEIKPYRHPGEYFFRFGVFDRLVLGVQSFLFSQFRCSPGCKRGKSWRLLQGGPLSVRNGIVTPINCLING